MNNKSLLIFILAVVFAALAWLVISLMTLKANVATENTGLQAQIASVGTGVCEWTEWKDRTPLQPNVRDFQCAKGHYIKAVEYKHQNRGQSWWEEQLRYECCSFFPNTK